MNGKAIEKAPAGEGTPEAGAEPKFTYSIPREEKMSNETTTIASLELENVKRIKAVQLAPTASGLTIIGGNNNQGKTSVLDAIMWILGGNHYRPSQAWREGSVAPPYGKITLSNGLVVERKGKNSDLKVLDPTGKRAGQRLLDEFISQFALDLPRFLRAGDKEKAQTLLEIIGVGDRLFELERREKDLYDRRRTIGQIADQKKKHAAELPVFPEAGTEPVSAAELIRQQQDILARNGENQRKRQEEARLSALVETLRREEQSLQRRLADKQAELASAMEDWATAQKSAEDLWDESTEELERSLADIEELNRKIRTNQDKRRAEEEAADYASQYEAYTEKVEAARKEKTALLDGADLPLPGLSVREGKLTYQGFEWDNLSGSDQMKVGVAIVRKLNPKCGFVLLDKLEQMDAATLREFGAWLQAEGLQAIATRVSTGDECSILIEDGYSKPAPAEPPLAANWEGVEF